MGPRSWARVPRASILPLAPSTKPCGTPPLVKSGLSPLLRGGLALQHVTHTWLQKASGQGGAEGGHVWKPAQKAESGSACHQGSHGWQSPGEPGAQSRPQGQAAQTALSVRVHLSVTRSPVPCPPAGPGPQLTVLCHLPLLAMATALSQATGFLSEIVGRVGSGAVSLPQHTHGNALSVGAHELFGAFSLILVPRLALTPMPSRP